MAATSGNSSIVVLVTNDGMGKTGTLAGTPLQHKLVQTYLSLLNDNGLLPAVICFYTDGVKLVVEGSPVLEVLKSLESKGVHLVICSTCLSFFGLTDKVRVGVVGGMTDIVEAQWRADKVITI
jgi:intracellular sulfur oxidation DsrE/DsrF family protein